MRKILSKLKKLEKSSQSRRFLIICFVAFIFRILAISLLPESPSSFGPDEGTYANLASWVEKSLPVSEFPLFGAGLYLTSKTFILPSILLIKLGIDPISSIRIISLMSGMLSIVFFYLTLKILFKNNSNQLLSFTAIYAFWPSNFLWSLLGLREATVQLWMIISIFLFFRLLVRVEEKSKIYPISILLILSITLLFGARLETAFVLSLTLLISAFIFALKVKKPLVVITILVGIYSGSTFITSQYNSTESGVSTTVLPPSGPSNTVQTKIDSIPQLPPSGPSNTLRAKIDSIPNFESKANKNRIDAKSALPEFTCSNESNSLGKFDCFARSLPYRAFSVLVRPLPYFDQGSLHHLLASFENLCWLLLILSTLKTLRLLIPFQKMRIELFLLWSIFAIYTFGLALFEGNLGSSFRHKTPLLPILFFILAIKSHINGDKVRE